MKVFMFTCNCSIIHNLMFLSTYGRHCQRKGANPITIFRPTIPFFHDETTIRRIQIRQDTPDNKNLDQVSAKCLLSFKRIRGDRCFIFLTKLALSKR